MRSSTSLSGTFNLYARGDCSSRGGWRWSRTTRGKANRFTVCPATTYSISIHIYLIYKTGFLVLLSEINQFRYLHFNLSY